MRAEDQAGAQATIDYENIAPDAPISEGRSRCLARSDERTPSTAGLAQSLGNPRRPFITMAAVVFGYAMLLFVACLMADLRWQMIENGTCLGISQI